MLKNLIFGISGRNVTEDLAEEFDTPVGVYVDTIEDDGPAKEAGLKEGDIITAIDDHEIKTIQELNNYKAQNYEIGDKVTLKVYRDDKEIEVKLTLGEQPQEELDDNSKNNDKKEPSAKDSDSLRDYYDSYDEFYNFFGY